MSTTWTFAQLVDTLKTQLEPLVASFDPGVEVRVSMPSADESISDVIVLGIDADDMDKGQVSLGSHTHDEEVTIVCLVGAIRYGSGDVEAKAARDRCLELLAVIDEEIRTNTPEVGVQTFRCHVTNRTFESFPSMAGASAVRVARITFDLEYRARTDVT